ncbi:hypothetical protein [Schlesneria paludicola]|uniref:hypothetical protein n=1 Tax=Schlesneria paludicola TaxID=360056 RepID=UPI0012F7135A|nr:hypothetical protein [Schlesneria paludicola]
MNQREEDASVTGNLPPNASAMNTAAPVDEALARLMKIRREDELAKDLTCFQPGQPLGTIRFIATGDSVHVAQWLTLFAQTQTFVEIETANPVEPFENECFSIRPILPRWIKKAPMSLRYLLSGLVMRFRGPRSSDEIFHAHCASGNGFAAWLSGRRYIIGVYGTEVFGAHERGFAYRWLLRQILQGAERIQVASTECVKILIEQYEIPPELIYCFHLGLDGKTFHGASDIERAHLRQKAGLPLNEPIWTVNRRTHPHYRTREVIQGFFKFCDSGGQGRLVLLCGESQADYMQGVRELIEQSRFRDRVTFIERMLPHAEVAAWLKLSDFGISVPKTDMLSVSTYQALGCGAVPILSDLESYNQLRPCRAIRWMNRFEPSDFAEMFAETANAWPTPHAMWREESIRFAEDGFSAENAIRDIAAFYLGVPLRKEGLAKWAA